MASQNSPAKPDPFLLGGVYVGTSPGAGQREGADGGRDIVLFFSQESLAVVVFDFQVWQGTKGSRFFKGGKQWFFV